MTSLNQDVYCNIKITLSNHYECITCLNYSGNSVGMNEG